MRYFNLIPGGGDNPAASEALAAVGEQLRDAGAKRVVLLVEDDEGVTISAVRLDGADDDSPKEATDLLLRVALDAKSLVTGDGAVPRVPR